MLQPLIDFYHGSYFMPVVLLLGPLVFLLVFGYQPAPPSLPSAKEDIKVNAAPLDNGKKEAPATKPKENEGIKPSSLFGSQSDTSKKTLPPPLDTKYTKEELAKHDGSDENLPVLLALKGDIFDVSGNRSTYGPGGGYSMFAAKDASRALGISSLKAVDCTDDLSGMTEQQLRVLDDWYKFFEDRYPIVGKVSK